MRRRPSDVVDVVAIVLERVQWLVLLEAPELDRPVEGRREEQMGEVYSALYRVRANAGDRSLMTLVRFCQSGAATVTAGCSTMYKKLRLLLVGFDNI